jgi:4-hydroxybenzoate polyprenyltransferase
VGIPAPPSKTALSRLKLFLALSRTPHGLLDLASPALAAILWLGAFPPFPVAVLGLCTAFAGYTAVYALNDVVDYRSDRDKFLAGGLEATGPDVDAVFVRHPMAQGLLSFSEGILWAAGWAAAALLGAWALNPMCAAIFIAGCLLEAVYCLLLRVSAARTAVSGIVKTLGGLAAVLAVDPHPSPLFLFGLFLWLFAWEIGGQNVPNDWADVEDDRRLRACTIPVRFGTERTSRIILGSLLGALILNGILFRSAPRVVTLSATAVTLLGGSYLLLLPACRLHRTKTSRQAAVLFNRASYYPLFVAIIVAFDRLR